MDVELQINNSPNPKALFVSWVPSPCRIRVTNPIGAAFPIVNLKITGVSAAGGGALVFRSGTTGAFANSVTLPVPINARRFRSSWPASSGDPAPTMVM